MQSRKRVPAPTYAVLVLSLWLAVGTSRADASGSPVPPPVRDLQRRALESDEAMSFVRDLVNEVGARQAGSAAYADAVRWAVQRLSGMGFDGVGTEPVQVAHWVRGSIQGEILNPVRRRVVLTSLGGSIGTPQDGVTAPVVGFESLEALRQAPDGSLEGKIAFVYDRMRRVRDGTGYEEAVKKRADGPSVAAEKGASALLIRSAGTSTARFAHTGGLQYKEGSPKIPAAALSNADADVLEALLDKHPTIRFRLDSSARMLDPVTDHNVWAEIRGRSQPEQIVLLACHLDSWDEGQGAQDDGVGCGIIVSAARLVAQTADGPGRTLRVVLFANEENGADGAKTYARDHEHELDRHVVGVEADDGGGVVWRLRTRVGAEAASRVKELVDWLRPLNVQAGDNEGEGGTDLGEMRKLGMPVLEPNQDTERYFDIHHTPNDILSEIDPATVKQAVAAYATIVYAASRPDWEFGRLAPESAGDVP